jgi:hypothetical protein
VVEGVGIVGMMMVLNRSVLIRGIAAAAEMMVEVVVWRRMKVRMSKAIERAYLLRM